MKKRSRGSRGAAMKRASSPIKPSPNRETLTYAQAQRMVELEVDGRVHRLSIYDKLDVIMEEDSTAQEIMECNSNKENSEKPPQVLLRSVRLKNSQQKKNAALAAAITAAPTPHGGTHTPLEPKFRTVEYNLPVVPRRPAAYYSFAERTAEELDEEVEYDMDEEDYAWLDLLNEKRRNEGISQVSHHLFEFIMDRLEKESHQCARGRSQPQVDEDAVCCICVDGDAADSNVILFCDSCNMAVHQECYGVPYVPEGQWLCRHCLQRPSQPAECIFCPNRGGALKKTDDGRWGHVVCALWVPEVGFSDTVFIEPIDGVANIPPARWKLTCYLCKEKGSGACIQCDRVNCYTAFHVSCAQQAGLHMRMEPIKEVLGSGATTFSVKKTAYCCAHSPADSDRRPLSIYKQPRPQNAAGSKRSRAKARKKVKRMELSPEPEPVPNSGPSITSSSVSSILTQVSVQRKRPFVERVLSYWILKRQSRNNVPLIRRLQANPQPLKSTPGLHVGPEQHVETSQALKEQLKTWHRLRHDLERTRLLLELIRKREKLKREEVKQQQCVLEVQLTPLSILLRAVLAQLQDKDRYHIFAQPVNTKEVADYLDVVQQPMDFSTMRQRVDAHAYRSLEEFESDFDLIISNCLTYNAEDTFFYKAALRMQDHGSAILRKARREALRIGFDFLSGMHLPELPPPAVLPLLSWDDVDRVLSVVYRQQTPLEQQLQELLEKLDFSMAMKHSPSRSKRLKLLKKTIVEVRREIRLKKARPPPPAVVAMETSSSHTPLPESLAEPPAPQRYPLTPIPLLPPLEKSPDNPESSLKLAAGGKPLPYATSDPQTATSMPRDPPDRLITNPPPPHDHASAAGNRRTNVLFRKSKSTSPQKLLKMAPAPPISPPLGTKTFLSVVIPRLETLLLPRKRTRSSSAEDEEADSPIKRLGTGLGNGFVMDGWSSAAPRRRCASESSISSSRSFLCSNRVSKSDRSRTVALRRNTVDDRSLMTPQLESEDLAAAAITPGGGVSGDSSAAAPVSPAEDEALTQRPAVPSPGPGRPLGRRGDAMPIRRETHPPRPLHRQQQLAMAS